MSKRCSQILNEVQVQINKILKFFFLTRDTKSYKLLDVGCWTAEATLRYCTSLGISSENCFGIDIFDHVVSEAAKHIKAHKVDLERDKFPFEDETFDIVICNQVFEHLKQIYLPMSEIHRVLKTKGILIFSVPNLASFHNRLLLLLGRQPTAIRIMGPHVRGFSHKDTIKFLEFNDLFKVKKVIGVGFYPFPIMIGRLLGRLFPNLSHTTIILAIKNSKGEKLDWYEEMIRREEQTSYFI